MKINVQIPEEDEDSPGVLFSSLMDAQGNPHREDDGQIHLYER